MDERKRKPGEIFRRAFFNQYNFIMLGGAALFSAVSGSLVPAVIGAGAEVLWLVLGADSGPFRRWVAKQETLEAKQKSEREIAATLKSLGDIYVDRFARLRRTGDEIKELAKENKGLETALVKDEMAKLEELEASFLKMAASHQRLNRFLQEQSIMGIERDVARANHALKSEADPRLQQSLRQSLTLAQKRLRQHQQIESAYKALTVEMETLEKAFAYLKSHILGIGTREELAAELDNLVTGVATLAELDASTDDLLREARIGASVQKISR